ncbi:MAG: response regulator [Sulfuricurvum sp.]|nr:response regulator [Sulfuricurvum sp.]
MINNLLYLHNDPEYEKNSAFMEAIPLNVFTADTVEAACAVFSHHPVHLLLVDQTLHESSGLDFIRRIREKNISTPAIMIISNLDQCNLLETINLNITQCLIKPYSQQNLCRALEIATKKATLCHPLTYTNLNFGYAYDPINKHLTTSEGKTIELCNKEALIIELLLQNDENITSYEMIENIVWQKSFMRVESLRTLIRGIRQKTHKNIITNHNGIGYKLDLKINLPSLDSSTSYLHHQ